MTFRMKLSLLWGFWYQLNGWGPELTPLETLENAVDRLNEAWTNTPRSHSIWIDWDEREVIVTTFQRNKVYPK